MCHPRKQISCITSINVRFTYTYGFEYLRSKVLEFLTNIYPKSDRGMVGAWRVACFIKTARSDAKKRDRLHISRKRSLFHRLQSGKMIKFEIAIDIYHQCCKGLDDVIRLAQNKVRYGGDLSLQHLLRNHKVNIMSVYVLSSNAISFYKNFAFFCRQLS